MNAALLLVDLQCDFLNDPRLEPAAGDLVTCATLLLEGARQAGVPVVHVHTTVAPDGSNRMPHWQRQGRLDCVAGTAGHEPPEPLAPRDESVVEKTWFSGFSNPELDGVLGGLGVTELIVCGVHLHGCVRSTVLDAYQRGFEVWVADDAVGGYDGLHGAVTRAYLEGRAARFASADELLGMLNGAGSRVAGPRPEPATAPQSDPAVEAAVRARSPLLSDRGRPEMLTRAAHLFSNSIEELAAAIVAEIGKPRRYAEAEVKRGVELLRVAARLPEPRSQRTHEAEIRRVPLGTVAQVTPFNNPLAVPLGKLAPALRYGNTVVWKPSPHANGVAESVVALLEEAGCPPGAVSLVEGGAAEAAALMADPGVDAVSLTGSSEAGYAAQAICARRRIPLQAELGGNNAAIVWSDCDLAAAAGAIAEGGFGAAGQRCTANRRVIVDRRCHGEFVAELEAATAALEIGDPTDPAVRIGPLVSEAALDRVQATLERARRACEVREPLADRELIQQLRERGPYAAPVLVLCEDAAAEIVQEETFGPVVVVQPAADFDQALELLNGVRQGLVAALFSSSQELRVRFLDEADAGVLKINRATADVGVEAPFGGRKASGVGPPEHGAENQAFYTRVQAVYS